MKGMPIRKAEAQWIANFIEGASRLKLRQRHLLKVLIRLSPGLKNANQQPILRNWSVLHTRGASPWP